MILGYEVSARGIGSVGALAQGLDLVFAPSGVQQRCSTRRPDARVE